ncbi:MAG: glycosyltransferase [Chloroflexi bacterium]|nr:glycosyltransferase [Chloroflexota bacterium]
MNEFSPPLKLAFISVHTSPLAQLGVQKSGGMNVYLHELARELGRRGHHIDIFTHRPDPAGREVDGSMGAGSRVIHLALKGLPGPRSQEELFEARQQFAAGVIRFATRNPIRYDLVYSHYWLSGWVAEKLKEIWQIPFIQMFHTLGQMKHRIANRSFPSTRTREELRITERADAIIAATPAERAQLRWLYRANRRKIHIVPPGVDTDFFQPRPAEPARRHLAVPPHAKVLLFVGRIEPLKAVDDILKALAQIRVLRPAVFRELRLLIVGGNPHELGPIRQLATRLALREKDTVHFLGPLPHSELPRAYAAADAVIMPSDYESFGMVALEALASGRPVIATQVGGLAHLIEDGHTGYHIPTREPGILADRILHLLSHEKTAAAMGHNAAISAQRYSWQRIGDELLAIFQRLLSSVQRDR